MAKVLIVDDERGMRVTLAEFLTDEGHDVAAVDDALKAIQLVAEQPFDVVVTDIIMPYFDGVDLLQAVRAAHPRIQVILITGEPFLDAGTPPRPAGAFAYLAKPVTRERICRVVAAAAAEKARLDEALI
ncbi:MAG: response regulator [Myxococcales bacterium]|nr:MAG: response regulator [Myxococcales bacterium]